MRADIQQTLQAWLNSPECADYEATLCLAGDLHAAGNVPQEWLTLRSLARRVDSEDEATQTLVMINVESLPAEMRANLGATEET